MTRSAFTLIAALCAVPAIAAATPSPTQPEVFAPGAVSGPANDDAPAFTADGRTVLFAESAGGASAIMISHRNGANWSAPRLASFSGQWSDQQPTMAPDGSFLVFVSNRPIHPGDPKHPGGNLWRVDRKGAGWGEPWRLPDVINADASVWAPSIAADGSLYFIRRPAAGAPFKLWRSQFSGGAYKTPVEVKLGDGTLQNVDPAVAPDETFLVFAAAKPGGNDPERLYIAFRKGDGWGAPIDLGDGVNGKTDTNGARLGPDHLTLYFTSDRQSPMPPPRTRVQAEKDLARMRAWDNGLQNIWTVSLKPWLAANRPG